MTIKTEGIHAGEHVLSEANGTLSRETITVVAGDALPAGQLLGNLTSNGKYDVYDNSASDGTQAVTGILYAPLPASDEDRVGVAHVRLTEVSGPLLTGLDTPGRADLKALSIIVR